MPETATADRSDTGRSSGSGATGWVPPRGRQRWQQADGEAMVSALRASGGTLAEFARRHGLHPARVQRWVARVAKRGRRAAGGAAVGFAPVRITEKQTAGSGLVLEVVVGGAVVRVGRGFDNELLRRVVAALGETSC